MKLSIGYLPNSDLAEKLLEHLYEKTILVKNITKIY
jgi:hypothetical protein